MIVRRRLVPGLVLVLAATSAGCSGDAEPEPSTSSSSPTASEPSESPESPDDGASEAPDANPADAKRYDAGLSRPVEDRVYPDVGDPGIDALHYDLDLSWDPDTSTLDATEVVTFRATGDADAVRLDLSPEMELSTATLDGEEVDTAQRGKNLVVLSEVVADRRYTLSLEYAGTPDPVAAPTSRADVPALGWTTMPDGSVWTMQEPYGGYTWYAVNDQPADKALYDFTPARATADDRRRERRARLGRRTEDRVAPRRTRRLLPDHRRLRRLRRRGRGVGERRADLDLAAA